jgi:hypothetical protein
VSDPHIDRAFAAILAVIVILGVALIVYAAARG